MISESRQINIFELRQVEERLQKIAPSVLLHCVEIIQRKALRTDCRSYLQDVAVLASLLEKGAELEEWLRNDTERLNKAFGDEDETEA